MHFLRSIAEPHFGGLRLERCVEVGLECRAGLLNFLSRIARCEASGLPVAVQDRSRTAFEKPTAGATVCQPACGRLAGCWQVSVLRGVDWVEAHLSVSPHTRLSFPLKSG